MAFASIVRRVLLLLFLALSGTAASQTTVTLMQGLNSGYTGTTDAHLWGGQPNTNRDDQIAIRTEGTGACSFCHSAVIRFAIPPPPKADRCRKQRPSPRRRSRSTSSADPRDLQGFAPAKGLDQQQQVTSSAVTGTSWTTAGANSANNDYVATPDAQATPASTPIPALHLPAVTANVCWVKLQLHFRRAGLEGQPTNFGWKLAQSRPASPDDSKNFNTSENPGFPNFRPKRRALTYTTLAGLRSPDRQPQRHAELPGNAPLNVVFDASASGWRPADHQPDARFGDGSAPRTSLVKKSTPRSPTRYDESTARSPPA